MIDPRIRALEARVDALESAVKKSKRDLEWLIALVVIVPVGLLLIIRLSG